MSYEFTQTTANTSVRDEGNRQGYLYKVIGTLGIYQNFCSITLILLSNTYFTSVYPTVMSYNATGQLQEPKDVKRPATVKLVFTILYSPEALPQRA